jgi:hypothetical protein
VLFSYFFFIEFKVEAVLISGILAYFILWFIGRSQNYRRATAWYASH